MATSSGERFGDTGGSGGVLPEELRDLDLLKDVEIVNIREGGLIDCWVPTGNIDHEEVPVDAVWVDSLVKDMARKSGADGGSGQETAIRLGLIPGEPKLKIVDGFHRDAALSQSGERRIYASVRLTDWDELFDDRIFTAKDHAHVRFSRVVQWIREAWQLSGAADQLTVEQAVLLYRFDTDGSKLGLDPATVAVAKAWIAKKEEQWQMKAMTIHSHLKIAEHVDPKLVHSTREKTNGKALVAPTQAILKIFSEQLPDQFFLQNLVMKAAMAHNLKGPQVAALCQGVAECTSQKAAKAYVQAIDWENWKPVYKEDKVRAMRRAHDPRHKGRAALSTAVDTITAVSERVDMSIVKGEEVTPEMQVNITDALAEVATLQRALGTLSVGLQTLRGLPNDAAESSEPEPESAAEANLATHEAWGLGFRVYPDEAPAVYVDGKGHFDFSDAAATVLFAVAQQKPRQDYTVQEIRGWLEEIGADPDTIANDTAIRSAIHFIDNRLKSLGKQDHVILHIGGVRNVRFGLMD